MYIFVPKEPFLWIISKATVKEQANAKLRGKKKQNKKYLLSCRPFSIFHSNRWFTLLTATESIYWRSGWVHSSFVQVSRRQRGKISPRASESGAVRVTAEGVVCVPSPTRSTMWQSWSEGKLFPEDFLHEGWHGVPLLPPAIKLLGYFSQLL